MNIVFAGTADFALPSLQALLDAPTHRVSAVFTQPDRPAGRGRQLQASVIKQLALSKAIPVFQPENLKHSKLPNDWLKHIAQADIMIVVAYGLWLPAFVLSAPRYGCINVHGSLLPRWRGASPIQQTILAGDTTAGVTIMKMVSAMDAGPLLKQAAEPVKSALSAGELHDKLAKLGADCLLKTLDLLQHNRITPIPQDEAKVTYAPKIKKEDGLIDWNKPADYLERHVRAFNPWPVAYGQIKGLPITGPIRVWRAIALQQESTASAQITSAPGQLLSATSQGIDVATGKGILRLLELQKPGSRRLKAADFINGLGR